MNDVTRVLLPWLMIGMACRAALSADEPGFQLEDLQAKSVAIRRQSARWLGHVGRRSAVPGLTQALRDDHASVRRAAAKSLGMLKDRRCVPGLLQALGDTDTNVRFYAAYALGEMKDRRALDALIQALDDSQWCVRDQAAWALKEIDDPSIIPPIVAMLRHPDADVKHLSWIVEHVASEDKVQQLAKLLTDPHPSIRLRALATIGRLSSPGSVEILGQALRDEHVGVRKRAIATLCELRDQQAVAALEQLLLREQDATVRQAARQAVLELSRHEALVAHWSFDQSDQAIVKNELQDSNHGRILGCRPVPGVSGQAVEFRGHEYIEFGQPNGLPMAGGPFTVTAWIHATASNGVVIARGGGFCGFSLYVKDGAAAMGIHRLQEGPAYIARGTQSVDGRWVFLAGVVREHEIQIFVDGQLDGSTESEGYIPGNCGQGMEIGFDVANSPAEITDHFQGVIDEVKIYAAALSPDEIVEQYRTERKSP